ncbi:hypothetical protein SEVIR_3G373140v4 [Setaria viridis]
MGRLNLSLPTGAPPFSRLGFPRGPDGAAWQAADQRAVVDRKNKKAAKAARHLKKQQEATRRLKADEDPLDVDAVLEVLFPSDPDSGSSGDESGEDVVETSPDCLGHASPCSSQVSRVGEPSGAPESRKRVATRDVSRERKSKRARSPSRRPGVPPSSRPPAEDAEARGGQSVGHGHASAAQESGGAAGTRWRYPGGTFAGW